MPISVGLMQAQRIKYYHTNTAFLSISPPAGMGQCGETCTIQVSVVNVSGGPNPAGNFIIFDTISNTTVASGTVTGGVGTVSFPITVSTLFIYAQFLGNEVEGSPPVVDYEFGRSKSASVVYNVTQATTTTTITNPPNNTSFCFTANESITATVTSGGPVTSGTVDFRLYSNDSTFVSLPSADLVSGMAISQVPSGTTTAGNTYYLQALYNGNSCFGNSSSLPGTSGLQVNSTDALATTTTIAATDGNSSWCYYNTKDFTITVNGPGDGYFPTSGTVALFTSTGFFGFQVATGNLSGTNSVVVTAPASSMSSFAFAFFEGDGQCYGSSESSFMSINPTTNAITMSNYSVPTYGCSSDSQDFYFQLHTSAGGFASGTYSLISSSHGTLASQTTSLTNGSVIHFSGVIVPAGVQTLHVGFTHNTPTGCFGDYSGPGFSYNSQGYVTPTINLTASASNYNFEPVTLTVRAYHNGGFTSLGGYIYYSWYAPDGTYHNDPANPYVSPDNGDPVTHSITYSEPPGGELGTYTFFAYYLPSHCYNAEYSNACNYNSEEEIR